MDYKNIDLNELRDSYNKFYSSLTKDERSNFLIQENKNRSLMKNLSDNMKSLILSNAYYEHHYSNNKWYKSSLFKIVTLILVIILGLGLTDSIKSTIVLSTILTGLGILDAINKISESNKFSNEVTQRSIEQERLINELIGNGISRELIKEMVEYSEDIKSTKFDTRYITKINEIPSEDELELSRQHSSIGSSLYPKFHLIFNLETMRFITRAEIFSQEEDLFVKVTNNSKYKYEWINSILDD